jgi:hypothetical protein
MQYWLNAFLRQHTVWITNYGHQGQNILRPAARRQRLSVAINLWSVLRTIFKTAFDISATQPKSWHRARQAEWSGLRLTDTSTVWSAWAPITIWCKRTHLHCVIIPEVGIACSSRLKRPFKWWQIWMEYEDTGARSVWWPSKISQIILNKVIECAVIGHGMQAELDGHWHEESLLQTQGCSKAE